MIQPFKEWFDARYNVKCVNNETFIKLHMEAVGLYVDYVLEEKLYPMYKLEDGEITKL